MCNHSSQATGSPPPRCLLRHIDSDDALAFKFPSLTAPGVPW
jgi:hypothetical protein